MDRALNDNEFIQFVDVGITPQWSLTIEAYLATNSPYGEFGWSGIPITYSSRTFSPYWDEEFENMTPLDREWWSCPIQCKSVAPLHLEMLKVALPDYQWELHQKWRSEGHLSDTTDPDSNEYMVGHVEVVGTDPATSDTVFSCLNVPGVEETARASGYPNDDPITVRNDILEIHRVASMKVDPACGCIQQHNNQSMTD